MLYPVCWGISEGGNVISPDSEFIFYGILDCCLIPITAAAFLLLNRRIDPAILGLYIRTYEDPIPSYRRVTGKEQVTETNGHGAVDNGPAQGVVEPGHTGAPTSDV